MILTTLSSLFLKTLSRDQCSTAAMGMAIPMGIPTRVGMGMRTGTAMNSHKSVCIINLVGLRRTV